MCFFVILSKVDTQDVNFAIVLYTRSNIYAWEYTNKKIIYTITNKLYPIEFMHDLPKNSITKKYCCIIHTNAYTPDS